MRADIAGQLEHLVEESFAPVSLKKIPHKTAKLTSLSGARKEKTARRDLFDVGADRSILSAMTGLSIFLFLGTLALSLWATWRVKAAYSKYSEIPASSGMTGAEVAARIMAASGIHDVEIVESNQMLGDHYDPLNKTLVLSSTNFHGYSTAAVGVAAHETGHAIQHKMAYAPLNMRMAAAGLAGYANMAVAFLPIVGFMTGLFRPMLLVMCIAWGVIMLFNLITLPVEFDASNRAKKVLLDMGFIRGQGEVEAVNQVLDAAALTYVAAFLTSLGYLLYYLLPLLTGGRRD
jgi:Zn-dependent membrane protease YugP